MLPKKNRLNSVAFDHVYERGTNHSAEHLYAKVVADTKAEYPRVAVVASKKVAKQATARNSLRRRGYAAVEPYFEHLPTGVGVILFMKSGVGDLSFKELEEEVGELLRSAGLLTGTTY